MIRHEPLHTGEFLLSEGNGYISREEVTLAASAAELAPGTVLGRLTVGGQYAAYNNADEATGLGTAVAILYRRAPDESDPQKVVIIARDAEVAAARLTGIDAAGIADLAAVGIIVR